MDAESFTTRVIAQPDESWSAAIADLDAVRAPVPLPARPQWAKHICHDSTLLVASFDTSGRCRAALGLEVGPTKILPWHHLARGHHLGRLLASNAGDAVLERVLELANLDHRMLRLNLEFILRSADDQIRIGAKLQALGFRRAHDPRNYRDTLVIDLAGTEQDVMGSFSESTRRELRQWSRRAVELRPIEDARYSDRLNAIAGETLARTAGVFEPRSWADRIALCKALPDHSRLVGLFRAGRDDPPALLAYAWGCGHGDYAQYADAGSTRAEDIKVPMMYPLMWDLIQWARRGGRQWFDMGGALSESSPSDDPRSGIDGFKRRFSKQLVRVGEEWVLERQPAIAAVASGIRRLATRLGLQR